MLTRDRPGSITVEEFAKVMSQSPGQPPSEAEVKKIIDEVDLDGDGTINFNGSYLSFFPSRHHAPPPNLLTLLPLCRIHHHDDGPALPSSHGY